MTGDFNQAIDQIADKLGVTVDKVTSVIPQYAGMKVATGTIGIATILALAALAVGLGVCGLRRRKRDEYDECGWTMVMVGFTAAVALGVFSCIVLSDVVGWAFFPDAKVAEMLVGALS